MTKVAFKKEWLDNGVIDKLLTELNSGTELNSEGNITFTAPDHQDLFFLLADGIGHSGSITRNDASAISYRSFLDLRKNGKVSRKPLVSEISRRIAELERTPFQKYTMWTKCRLKEMSFASSAHFEVDEVTIKTSYRLPKWLQLEEYFISGVGRIDPNVLPFFGHIIFSVKARNENEASKRIFAAADTFFAIANTSRRAVESWTQRVPSAKLWLGPHQFFFEKRRFLGKNRVWYNPNYDEAKWNRFPESAEKFFDGANQIRRVINTLTNHPLHSELRNSLLLISEGMISDDLAFRLMRFWSAAEALYAAGEDKTPSKKLISRLTFASKSDVWLDKIKLERCYNLRNLYVHRGSNEADDTSLVQHLRELLLHQIYYYLFHGRDIASHADLLMMVDLPADETDLDRRKTAIDRRLNIVRSGRHSVSTEI